VGGGELSGRGAHANPCNKIRSSAFTRPDPRPPPTSHFSHFSHFSHLSNTHASGPPPLTRVLPRGGRPAVGRGRGGGGGGGGVLPLSLSEVKSRPCTKGRLPSGRARPERFQGRGRGREEEEEEDRVVAGLPPRLRAGRGCRPPGPGARGRGPPQPNFGWCAPGDSPSAHPPSPPLPIPAPAAGRPSCSNLCLLGWRSTGQTAERPPFPCQGFRV